MVYTVRWMERHQEERKKATVVFRDRFTREVKDVRIMVEASGEESEKAKEMKEMLY